MQSFETFVLKFGEYGVQALLENWERFHGISPQDGASLKHRWEIFISQTSNPTRLAA